MRPIRRKVPFVMQMEALECGAASLSMVLAHYGKWMTLPELRQLVGVSRDGVNALSIVHAARKLGLEAKGFRWKAETLREKAANGEAPMPAILFWRGNHFVVLCGMTKHAALINDPAIGPIRVTWDEFAESYSEVTLTFEPESSFKPSGKRTSVIDFAKERLAQAKSTIAFLSLAGIAAAAITAIQPALASSFIDKVLSGSNPSWIGSLLGAMAAIAVLQALLLGANASYQIRAQGRLALAADYAYMRHMLRLPLTFFHQRMAGDIHSRQRSNAQIAQTLIATLVPIGVGMLAMAVYLCAMLSISPALTLIGVTALILNALLAQAISRKRVRLSRQIARDGGNLSGSTSAILAVIESIKAGGGEVGVFAQWAGMQASVVSGQAAISKLNIFWGSVPQLVMDIANAALLSIGAMLIMQGHMTSGLFLAFQSLMQSFVQPSQQLISTSQSMIEMRTDMERIEDVVSHAPDPVFAQEQDATRPTIRSKAPATIQSRELSGNVSVRGVTFGYSPTADPLLTDLSLELSPGRSVALVGPSGCGKSTVAKLVANLYQPWSGEILFDGAPACKYERQAFTRSIGLVDQDVFLFPGTIRESFLFADPDISEESMVQAAVDAGIHEAILKHPDGYDGVLAEGGQNFSGGQRQQLEIARVLAGNPKLIILDEATSALDAQTEARVMDAIRSRGAAMLIIAHRLSTVRDADEIIVLDSGTVAERGRHAELMTLGGSYANLVATA